jgi:hypothetical protein
MGREATVRVEYAGRSGDAKALLEAEGLIFRAPMTGRISRATISDLTVEEGALVGIATEGEFRLHLGEAEAAKWKSALKRPLPTLAEKMSVKPGLAIWTSGAFDTPELAALMEGTVLVRSAFAELRLIRAESLVALMKGLEASNDAASPIWVVHGKGRSPFGGNATRQTMRELGYVDVKSCAVSTDLSATRYLLR